MAEEDRHETFLERLLHLAAKQGIAISTELRALIVKATDEIEAVDKRLTRKARKKPRAKLALAKAKRALPAKAKAKARTSTSRRKPAKSKRPRRKA